MTATNHLTTNQNLTSRATIPVGIPCSVGSIVMLMKTELAKYGTPEWYEAYRNRRVSSVMKQHTMPGEITLEPITPELAMILAQDRYDVESLPKMDNGLYAIRTRSGYAATVGTYENHPALIHKNNDGTRTLELFRVEFTNP